MSSCGLLFVFIYSSAVVFMIVNGQSTTGDTVDINADLHSVVEQQASTIATLRAEFNNLKAKQARSASTIATLEAKVETLETRLSSVAVDNRKLFTIKLSFAVCSGT